jgi:hypothetical protein
MVAGWRLDVLGWRGLLAAVLLSSPAWAADGEATTEEATDAEPVAVAEVTPSGAAVTEAPSAAAPAVPRKPEKKKKGQEESLGEDPDAVDDAAAAEEEKDGPQVRIFGRVFARASADERDEYVRALRIPDARVGVGAAFGNIEAEVTADLSSKNILKDAFVRLADDAKRFRLYGGQFKAPFLARELESTWRLPMVNRGLVNEYLVDTHELGGRRFGLMGELRLKKTWDLKVSAGLFQGGEGLTGERLSEDASARVSVEPFNLKWLTVGASTYLGEVLEGTRRYAAAADATVHLGGFALSAEYVTGQIALGPFDAQLAMASYALPLDAAGEWALQPVLGAESLRLRGDVVGQGWAALGGVNILYVDSFKAQFQVERALRPGDAAPGLEYSLQLATRF